jgi:hypothetical protein
VSDDLRAVLESIAFAGDASVSAGDRLKAVEQLTRLGAEPQLEQPYARELAGLKGAELDSHLDAVLAEQIADDIFGPRLVWSNLAARVDREVECRARTLAEEMSLDMVEAEIQGRVAEELTRREPKPPPPEAPVGLEGRMASALPNSESRYRAESGLRRRYRSRLLAR